MENKRLFTFILLLILSSSCSRNVINPPHPNFMNLTGSLEPSKSDILAKKFHLANLDFNNKYFEKSCSVYEELLEEGDFPLQSIALIRAIKSCDWTVTKLISIWDSKSVEPWLAQDYHLISLEVAKSKNIKLWQAKHNFALYPFEKRKEEKEKFIRNALEIAEDEQITELVTKYNEELQKISPRFITAPSDELLYDVARDFERAREYDKAIATYENIIKNSSIDLKIKINSWHRITRVFKNKRRKDLALSSTKTLVNWITKNKELFGTQYGYELVEARTRWARATWTENNLPLAKKILTNTLNRNNPESEQAATIYYLLAGIAKEEKKIKSAIVYLKKSVDLSTSSQREDILWQLAWLEYKRKNYSESTTLFKKLHSEYDDVSKYTYWLAKSLSREKKTKESIEFFSKTIELNPFGYYGISAKRNLGLKDGFNLEVIESSKDNLFEWLIALGEYEKASKYLDSLIYSSKSASSKLSLLERMNRARNFQGSLKTFFNMGEDQRLEIEKKFIQYIYPKPVLESKYLENNFDNNLAYSIIRQESAFNREARSFADAYGLMQIIPSRAKKLAKKHRIPYQNTEDLYDIDVNMALGVHYLEDLKKMFDYLPMAIGSYNAGEAVMSRWVKSRYQGDIETFIEDIPYRETRKYIKLVLRNYYIYQQLPIDKKVFIY
ncbi:putative transglycosylase [Halobacteriovorax marinus SJ]|uniref:Transglycosylase n=1 Tax=Halobacteriovorax marinus (strain ATCC BAA-682 / DSM 15412 / SJ) TaxID=862908 RepID=E1X020_HALMS|nr:lytic transglycosylase domain-containing protein [Halobacteriovorax marinus]CBW27956.1 putative transglycosylase [Halobacteriovorax marinus SJ]